MWTRQGAHPQAHEPDQVLAGRCVLWWKGERLTPAGGKTHISSASRALFQMFLFCGVLLLAHRCNVSWYL